MNLLTNLHNMNIYLLKHMFLTNYNYLKQNNLEELLYYNRFLNIQYYKNIRCFQYIFLIHYMILIKNNQILNLNKKILPILNYISKYFLLHMNHEHYNYFKMNNLEQLLIYNHFRRNQHYMYINHFQYIIHFHYSYLMNYK